MSAWTGVSITVEAGSYKVEWAYLTDDDGLTGAADTGWVRNLTIAGVAQTRSFGPAAGDYSLPYGFSSPGPAPFTARTPAPITGSMAARAGEVYGGGESRLDMQSVTLTEAGPLNFSYYLTSGGGKSLTVLVDGNDSGFGASGRDEIGRAHV